MLSVDLTIRTCGDHAVVALRGELDIADAADVASALTAAAAGHRGAAVVDLAGLAFIDCSGAAALVLAHSRVRQAGGLLLLAAPRPQVRRVFVLSRLIDAVSFYASVNEATGVCDFPGMVVMPRPCA
jgi:anti-anti-sigma factor